MGSTITIAIFNLYTRKYFANRKWYGHGYY